MAEEKRLIDQLLLRWNLRFFLVLLMAVLGLGMLLWSVSSMLDIVLRLALLAVPLLLAVIMARKLGWPKSRFELYRQLHQQHPEFEYSLSLLVAEPERLSLPARLQRERIAQRLLASKQAYFLPVPWKMGLTVFSLGMLAFIFLELPVAEEGKLQSSSKNIAKESKEARENLDSLQARFPSLKTARLQVSPPTYTGLPSRQLGLEELEAPVGSRITWLFELSQSAHIWLRFAEGDSLPLSRTAKGQYTAQIQLQENRLYQLWLQETSEQQERKAASPFILLKARPDLPPAISLEKEGEPYERKEQPAAFSLQIALNDDYGLGDAYVQTTLSRGSGEGVKFFQDKHWLENVGKGSKRYQTNFSIDPGELGMQPGDELYYHVVAFDNRQPRPQESRSSTFYLKWLDSTEVAGFTTEGMAMDLMPDYFRSQRQIIIDTEKLLEEAPQLSEDAFAKRSNDIGIDQKLLRLRYGKFLGEEFESDAGLGPEENEDAEHEHEESHEHEHEEAGQEATQQTSQPAELEAYMHIHDIEEGATFYEEAVKVKLKAALAQMWEAELRLRTIKPKEALPYEYEALRIIKDLQQSTRIYVERIGFEPPALRPDKRLSGEAEEVRAQFRRESRESGDSLAALYELRKALAAYPLKSEEAIPEKLVEEASLQLARFSLQKPSPAALESLRLLRQWQEQPSISYRMAARLAHRLGQALPPQALGPVPHRTTQGLLAQALLDSLAHD